MSSSFAPANPLLDDLGGNLQDFFFCSCQLASNGTPMAWWHWAFCLDGGTGLTVGRRRGNFRVRERLAWITKVNYRGTWF